MSLPKHPRINAWHRLRVAIGLVLLLQFAGYKIARGHELIGVTTLSFSSGPQTMVWFAGDSIALRVAFWPMWQLEALDGGDLYLVNEL